MQTSRPSLKQPFTAVVLRGSRRGEGEGEGGGEGGGALTGMPLLRVELYTQERMVVMATHPSKSCRDSDTFSWKSSADLLVPPK